MKRQLLVSAACLFMSMAIYAQKITDHDNTAQGWAGGVCCISGVKYQFNLEFNGFKNEPVPDSMWVGGECIQLLISDSALDGYSANTHRIRKGKTVIYKIYCGVSHDEKNIYNPGAEVKRSSPEPIKHNGVALVAYHLKGQKKVQYYSIRTMKELEFQAYP